MTIMQYFVYLILIFLTFLDDGITEQPCPSTSNIQNFNETKFAGKWYEIKRFKNTLIKDECGNPNYVWESNLYNVNYAMFNIETNSSSELVLQLKNKGNDLPGKYIVYVNDAQDPIPHAILDTDYSTYSIIWGCIQENETNIQRLFIYSRNLSLSETASKKVQMFLEDLNIKYDDLVTVEQDDEKCGRGSGPTTLPTISSALVMVVITIIVSIY